MGLNSLLQHKGCHRMGGAPRGVNEGKKNICASFQLFNREINVSVLQYDYWCWTGSDFIICVEKNVAISAVAI